MRTILIDVENEKAEVLDVDANLQTWYKHLNCNLIDMVTRKIGDRSYVIVCDDEGLLTEAPKISAVDEFGSAMLVGNLMIYREGKERDVAALTIDDCCYISKRVKMVRTRNFPEGYPMLTECCYA